jgi:hypothetical protein
MFSFEVALLKSTYYTVLTYKSCVEMSKFRPRLHGNVSDKDANIHAVFISVFMLFTQKRHSVITAGHTSVTNHTCRRGFGFVRTRAREYGA